MKFLATALVLAISLTSFSMAQDAPNVEIPHTPDIQTIDLTIKTEQTASTTPFLSLSYTPKQYSATYQSEYQGRSVNGTRSLIKQGDHWVLQTKLNKWMIAIVEEATVAIKDKQLVPISYEYRRSIFGKVKKQTLNYDHEQQRVNYYDAGDKGSYALPPHSFDKASQQFLIEEQLRSGAKAFKANNAARNRIKPVEYRVLGEKYIELPIGVTKAIQVEIVPKADSKRHTVMWFDPERNYLLVQLNQTDKKGKTYTMQLSDIRFLD